MILFFSIFIKLFLSYIFLQLNPFNNTPNKKLNNFCFAIDYRISKINLNDRHILKSTISKILNGFFFLFHQGVKHNV